MSSLIYAVIHYLELDVNALFRLKNIIHRADKINF